MSEWQPMEDAPQNGDVIEAWHGVHECIVTVRFQKFIPDCPWVEVAGGTAWPDLALMCWRVRTEKPLMFAPRHPTPEPLKAITIPPQEGE